MKLRELLRDIAVLACNADLEADITAICYDSRKAEPGCLFVAVTGFAADGNRFIPMALEKGAAAVVTAKKPDRDIPYILVESDRLALALLTALPLTGSGRWLRPSQGRSQTTLAARTTSASCTGNNLNRQARISAIWLLHG